MVLVTQSLFEPVQEWIRGELGTPPGAPVVFRFDRFGVTLSDADFMLPGHPELGFSAPMAIERFSDLVNRTPVDLGTGDAVVLTEIDIDTSYFFRIVNPAEPYLPANLSGAGRERRIVAFDVLKAQALKSWEKLGLTSVTGQIRDFRPSTPAPIDWYDPGNSAGWQSRTFTVAGAHQASASATLQWRLRPSDTQIGKAVGLTIDEAQKLPALELVRRAAHLQRGDPVTAPRAPGPTRTEILNPFLNPELRSELVNVPLSDRVLAKRRLLEVAPAKPATTSSTTTITFDACLVRIDRPWLFWPFLTDATWDVPGIPRGGVTQPGTIGALTWLPTAMLAIRNLKITSDWSAQDIEASATATNFGPFAVSGKINNRALSSPGLQVIGWQLQQLPTLPPNDEAASTPSPQRDYVVVQGDTLWNIARMMYGDGGRYRDIAEANHLTNPDKIKVGQHLVIP